MHIMICSNLTSAYISDASHTHVVDTFLCTNRRDFVRHNPQSVWTTKFRQICVLLFQRRRRRWFTTCTHLNRADGSHAQRPKWKLVRATSPTRTKLVSPRVCLFTSLICACARATMDALVCRARGLCYRTGVQTNVSAGSRQFAWHSGIRRIAALIFMGVRCVCVFACVRAVFRSCTSDRDKL